MSFSSTGGLARRSFPPWLWKAALVGVVVGGAKLAFDWYSSSKTSASASTSAAASAEDDLASIDVDADAFAAGVLFAKKKLSSRGLSISDKLALYAFYKQGTEGDCNIETPSLADMAARAKYDAWMKCKGMSKDEAEGRYLEVLEGLSPGWKERVRAAAARAGTGAAEEEEMREDESSRGGGENDNNGGMGFSHTSRPSTYLLAAPEEQKEEEDGDNDDKEGQDGSSAESASPGKPDPSSLSSSAFVKASTGELTDAIMEGKLDLTRDLLATAKDKEEKEQLAMQSPPPDAGSGAAGGRRRKNHQMANHPLNSAAERPLHLAVDAGQPKIVELLLSFGADPTLTENEAGSTPLHYAVSLERYEELEVLLRHALLDQQQQQQQQQTSSSSVSAAGEADSTKRRLKLGEESEDEGEGEAGDEGDAGNGKKSGTAKEEAVVASRLLVQELSPKAWARHLLFELEDDDGNTVWSLAEGNEEAEATIRRVCEAAGLPAAFFE